LVALFDRHVILARPAAQAKFLNQIGPPIIGINRRICHCVTSLHQSLAIGWHNLIGANPRQI
jgi:hypothetical protein